MAMYPLRTRRWTREEYERLIEVGVFRPGEPVELLGGQLVVREPQKSEHHTAVGLVEDALRATLPTGWLVRSQGPIELDDESEPEPDVAVVPGDRRTYSHRHPDQPVLVVEVLESSLAFAREHKGGLYARARLEDYWIVNLIDRVVEVFRQPVADAATPFGWRYATRDVRRAESSAELLAVPGTRVRVADLLP
jgi:Uma2 family endonuclease